MQGNIKSVSVKARVVTNKKVEPPTTFTAFTTVGKDGKTYDVRFKRCCTIAPTGDAICLIAEDKMHIQQRENKPPVLWVEDVINILAPEVEELPF